MGSRPAPLDQSKGTLAPLLQRIKYVYTDLDGTLLGPGGSVFRSADGSLTLEPAAALIEALDAGLEIIPVSGRNKYQLLDDVRILGLSDYVAEAGCLIVHNRLEEEWTCVGDFPAGDGTIYDRIVASGAAELLFDAFPGRLEYHLPWTGQRECSHMLRGNVDLERARALLASIDLPLKLIDNGIIRPRRHALVGVDEVHAYHLLPLASSKPDAVSRDLDLRGAAAAEAVAIGDSASDLELCGEVAAFFLVANALADEPVARKAATYANVFVTQGEMGMGWAEAVRAIVAAKISP